MRKRIIAVAFVAFIVYCYISNFPIQDVAAALAILVFYLSYIK